MNDTPDHPDVDIDAVMIADLRHRKSRLTKDLSVVQERLNVLEAARTLRGEFFGQIKADLDMRPLTEKEIENKTQKEILKIIARRNHLWLVAQSAIKLMVDVGVLQPDSASAQVYTVLGKSKNEFVLVQPGIYRLQEPSGTQGILATSGVRTGITDKVKEILESHPEWKVPQIHNELIKQGWDFGDKIPKSSIAIAIANLTRHELRPTRGQTSLPVFGF